MKLARPLWGFLGTLMLPVALAQADSAVLRQADGSTVRITDLGNGIGIVADPHGINSPTPLPPEAGRDFSGRPGVRSPEMSTPFGTPAPPNNLTPPPTLPFNPNRTLLPSPSVPPSGSVSGPGRFGR